MPRLMIVLFVCVVMVMVLAGNGSSQGGDASATSRPEPIDLKSPEEAIDQIPDDLIPKPGGQDRTYTAIEKADDWLMTHLTNARISWVGTYETSKDGSPLVLIPISYSRGGIKTQKCLGGFVDSKTPDFPFAIGQKIRVSGSIGIISLILARKEKDSVAGPIPTTISFILDDYKVTAVRADSTSRPSTKPR